MKALVGDLPSDERPGGEVGGEERLADAADRAGGEERADALDDRLDGYAGAAGDLGEGIALEGFKRVLGDRQDSGVDWVV